MLYHRIIVQPHAQFRNGDRMLLLLERFEPGRSPYHGIVRYDYSIAGADSEGAYFFRGGKVEPIHGVWGDHIPAAVLISERKFVDWLLRPPPVTAPVARR